MLNISKVIRTKHVLSVRLLILGYNNLNLSETNKEDNILTDRNEEQTKVHKQKLKNAMSLLKVKKVDGSIDDIPF